MSAYNNSQHVTIRFLALALALIFLLAACERPLQSDGDGQPAPTSIVPDEPTPAEPTAPAEPTLTDPTSEAEMPEQPAATETPAEDQSPRPGDEGQEGDEGEGEEPGEDATAQPPAEATPEPPPEPTAAPTEAPAGSDQERLHVVQRGENLYRIGLQYGISWSVLAEYNGIANPNSLFAGQEIRIPPEGGAEGPAPTPAPQVTHVVQPGETLFIISQQYGVLWPDIAAANNLTAPYTIQAGQTLVIPGGQ